MPIHNLYFKTLSLILFIHAGESRIITAYIALQCRVLSWFVSTHAERTVSCRQTVNSFVCFCYFKGLFKCFIETTAVTWQPSQGASVRSAKSRSELCDNALGRWAFKQLYIKAGGYTRKNATDLLQPVAPSGLIQIWYHSCIRLLTPTDCSELTVSDWNSLLGCQGNVLLLKVKLKSIVQVV